MANKCGASGAMRGAAYVKEAEYGKTPDSPTMQLIRHTGMNLNLSKGTITSEERNETRQLSDLRHGNRSGSGSIPVELAYEGFDDFLEAVLGGDWSDDTLRIGNKRRSFTIEDRLTDIDMYRLFSGVVLDQLQVQIQPGDDGALVNATFSTLSKDMVVNDKELASPSSPTNNEPFDTFNAKLKVGGQEICASSLEFTLNNNYAANYCIGSDTASCVTPGQVELTGTLTKYLAGDDQIKNFLDEETLSLEIELEDPDGNKLAFKFPRIKYTSDEAGDNSQSISEEIGFTAIYDKDDETALKITRKEASNG